MRCFAIPFLVLHSTLFLSLLPLCNLVYVPFLLWLFVGVQMMRVHETVSSFGIWLLLFLRIKRIRLWRKWLGLLRRFFKHLFCELYRLFRLCLNRNESGYLFLITFHTFIILVVTFFFTFLVNFKILHFIFAHLLISFIFSASLSLARVHLVVLL